MSMDPGPYPAGLFQAEGIRRFSMDGPLLAAFAARRYRGRPGRPAPGPCAASAACRTPAIEVLDLGCGAGACIAGFLRLRDDARGVGIDIVPAHIEAAAKNARLLGLEDRLSLALDDVARLAREGRHAFDVVLCNPPYWEEGSGRASLAEIDDLARRARQGNRHFLAAAAACLRHHGTLYLVYPARRLCGLIAGLREHRLGVRALCAVRSLAGSPATRVLVEARKAAADDTLILPDLVLYQSTQAGGTHTVTPQALDLCPWMH